MVDTRWPTKEQRHELTLEDVREISRQSDMTLRFVLPVERYVWKDLFQVIEAVDQCKHLVVLDSMLICLMKS